jgi:hypothetical protein
MFLKFSNIIFIDEFYRALEEQLKCYCNYLSNKYKHVEKMQKLKDMNIEFYKFTDIFELLEDLPEFGLYIIIDQIEDIELVKHYSKNFQKVLQMTEICNIKFILISNFDMGSSELVNILDFSNFMSLTFPRRNVDKLKEMILTEVDISNYDSTLVRESLNTCVNNYFSNFCNFEEYLIGFEDNLKYAKYPNEFDLENNFSHMNLNSKDSGLNSSLGLGIGQGGFQKPITNQIQPSQNPNTNNVQNQKTGNKLRKNIIKQITSGPLHINYLTNSTYTPADTNNNSNAFGSSKNLTESLSRSQKVLLLAAFFASESSPKIDSVIFKNVKKTKIHTRQVCMLTY